MIFTVEISMYATRNKGYVFTYVFTYVLTYVFIYLCIYLCMQLGTKGTYLPIK